MADVNPVLQRIKGLNGYRELWKRFDGPDDLLDCLLLALIQGAHIDDAEYVSMASEAAVILDHYIEDMARLAPDEKSPWLEAASNWIARYERALERAQRPGSGGHPEGVVCRECDLPIWGGKGDYWHKGSGEMRGPDGHLAYPANGGSA